MFSVDFSDSVQTLVCCLLLDVIIVRIVWVVAGDFSQDMTRRTRAGQGAGRIRFVAWALVSAGI